jgi:WhiB family redox-sensing transcriptional regulator
MTVPTFETGAVCATADPELWFSSIPSERRHAKELCATCPLLLRCAEYAVADPELMGIWGGLGEDERKEIQRARGIVPNRWPVGDACGDARGTDAGFQRHRSAKESSCEPCLHGRRLRRKQGRAAA